MANCQVEVSNETPDIVLPRVAIMNPSEGTVVSGTTEINIDASDNSGKDPYVTIYVNKNLRYMTDRSPYSYNWDTTQETDGPKTIEVTAVDASNNFAKAKAVQVTVRNQAAQASVSKPLSISVASATSASTSATPMAKPLAHETESARTSTETKAPESFEVNQIQKPAASKPQTVAVNPPAPVSIPVVPKPDVKVESTPVPQVARIIPPTTAVSEPTKAPKLVAYTPEFMGGFISKEASQRLMDISPKPTTAVAPKASSKAASGKVYIVQDGESILMIAKKLGVPMKRLIALNNLQDPYLLHIGDKLAVPGPAKMVPIRPAFQATGGTVAWDNVKKEVRATDSQHNVVLKPGSAQAVVNSEKVKMDAPAVIQSGRTLVPGSFITETLGMK